MPDTREEAEWADGFSRDHADIGADRTRDRHDAEGEEELRGDVHDTLLRVVAARRARWTVPAVAAAAHQPDQEQADRNHQQEVDECAEGTVPRVFSLRLRTPFGRRSSLLQRSWHGAVVARAMALERAMRSRRMPRGPLIPSALPTAIAALTAAWKA